MSNQIELDLSCSDLPGVDVVAATVTEALSRPTHAELLLTSESELDEQAPLGKPAELTVAAGGEERLFRLIVTAVGCDGQRSDRFYYRVTLDHPLALLALRRNVRSFQNQTALEIVKKVAEAAGLGDKLRLNVTRTVPQRTYCVQYRESDLDFWSRLLEHEGVFYAVVDESGGSFVDLADSSGYFEEFKPGDSEVELREGVHGDGVHRFDHRVRVIPSSVTVRDHDYEAPQVDVSSEVDIDEAGAGHVYEYPAGCKAPEVAVELSTLRAEEIAVRKDTARGESDRIGFRPGTKFQLAASTREDLNQSYVLTRVVHRFSLLQLESERVAASYSNDFDCFPAERPYRPARVTALPCARGVESVLVTGPTGEEIHTDELARMQGLFHWDREREPGADASCWFRVVQLPLGGSMALARVGWEMLVTHEAADPDRPIAIARVDNATHTAPYAYPTAMTAMAMKTLSSPGGGKYNEFSMEDGAGGMKFGATAAHDLTEQVNNDKTVKVTANDKLKVGLDYKSTVGGNQTVTIGAMHAKTVKQDAGVTVVGDRTKTVGAMESVTVSGNVGEKIIGSDTECVGGCHVTAAGASIDRSCKGAHSLTVGGAMISAAVQGASLAIGGARAETVGGAKIAVAGGAVAEVTGKALTQTVGAVAVNAAGGNCATSAKGALTIKVGGVALGAGGQKIQISAKAITIEVAGVAALVGGGGVLTLTPAAAAFVGNVTAKGSSSVTITGSPNVTG